MNKGRVLRTAVVAGVVSGAIAACGGGGADPPSALDPASMVPAGAIMYASITVRPQGSVRSDLDQAIDSVAGEGSASRLWAKLDKSLGSTAEQMTGWVGQRVGIALTSLPANLTSTSDLQSLINDVVIVAPTNDPSDATSFINKNFNGADESGKVVGHYAIFGGQSAVGEALATTANTSLAAKPAFKSAMSQIGSRSLVSFYAAAHPLFEAIVSLDRASGQVSASQLSQTLKHMPPPGATETFGLSALPHEFRFDVVTHGLSTSGSSGPPSDVSSLPDDSWLALALSGGLAKSSTITSLSRELPQLIQQMQAANATTGSIPSATLRFIEQDLVPALGPMSLSVSGTSRKTLKAGLVISPLNPGAGARLATGIKQLVAGLPITATTKAGRVAVTFGYKDLQQLLSPSSTLASNPTFKNALGQLPSGAKASIFMNFGPLAMLSALDKSRSDAAMWRVVRRLDYVIGGGTHTHFRLVLATH